MAAIQGLGALKKPCRVQLYTDSIYVRDGITSGSTAGSATAGAPPTASRSRMPSCGSNCSTPSARTAIEWHWVKGHSGHAENDRVDALACAAADAQRGK